VTISVQSSVLTKNSSVITFDRQQRVIYKEEVEEDCS